MSHSLTKPRLEANPAGPSIRKTVLYSHVYQAPFGPIYLLVTREGSVFRTGFTPDCFQVDSLRYRVEDNKYACGELAYQLDQYFQGRRQFFDLNLLIVNGTDFQRDVWTRMTRIEFGNTISYGEIARKVGRRDAARAVGNAVGRNPLPILIPCHRVLPQAGGLGGYCTPHLGLEQGQKIKRFLLDLESSAPKIL